MNKYDEIEKLAHLKDSGVITEEEFKQQKEALLNQEIQSEDYSSKSMTVYLLLASFLGIYGVHQFYAGRIKRGLFMLILSVLPFILGMILPGVAGAISFLFLGIWYIMAFIWVFASICTNKTDSTGKFMKPNPILRVVLIVIGVFIFLLGLGVFVIGGLSGYAMAMNRHRANQLLEYSANTAVTVAIGAPESMGIYKQDCASFLNGQPVPVENIRCLVSKNPHEDPIVYLENVPERVSNSLISHSGEEICIRRLGPTVMIDFSRGC